MKKFLSKVLLVCLSLLVTLLLSELLFRLLDIRYPLPRRETWKPALVQPGKGIPGIGVQFKPHSQFKIHYDSNPDGYFDSENGVSYRINNYGFRGPDFALEKPEGVRRILVLGDSFTMGDGVHEEDTYCHQLELELKKKFPVEVFNLGISGWKTRDEILYLNAMGIQFQPDLVIVAYVLNDAVFATGPPDEMKNEFESRAQQRLTQSSYLFNYVHTALQKYRFSRLYLEELLQSPVKQRREWANSLKILASGKRTAHENGSQYMVCLFPFFYELNDHYPLKPLHELVMGHCKKHDIPALDFFDAFRGLNHAELWVHPSDQHPNYRAHKIAALALAKFILQEHLID